MIIFKLWLKIGICFSINKKELQTYEIYFLITANRIFLFEQYHLEMGCSISKTQVTSDSSTLHEEALKEEAVEEMKPFSKCINRTSFYDCTSFLN